MPCIAACTLQTSPEAYFDSHRSAPTVARGLLAARNRSRLTRDVARRFEIEIKICRFMERVIRDNNVERERALSSDRDR
jgi:hypothetical protein